MPPRKRKGSGGETAPAAKGKKTTASTSKSGHSTVSASGIKVEGTQEKSFELQGETYAVGDTILVRSPAGPPFLARISKIVKPVKGPPVKILVVWYYRPEEAQGGRKQYHGEREVFDSDHCDWCELTNINGKCKVLSMKKYQRLKAVTENIFYCRFTYAARTGEFSPDRVSVYCTCEMPYNPDEFMVQCDTCHDWFHARCLGAKVTSLQQAHWFLCPYCKRGIPYEKRAGDLEILPEDYMITLPATASGNALVEDSAPYAPGEQEGAVAGERGMLDKNEDPAIADEPASKRKKAKR
mmetsp:Transcript_40713/g.49384  ORF Transcript_40713/g.49384 Transcript_40713/m.49384 type:complete len:296 (+) Transcript_40713:376-1263(+)|eukprot:CAMPEP_0197852210 /NCGR_PEP_ID=MMETSP1438-20131217/19912_1 /TAXON_ID=1461541 /ORGANISM="Pterosperma sp., Strain CCMP1384" /LENGTH=295 /DNA_ID=CAMNT_0043466119 /DNA_START=376 /DNA_END=1263 /DNA_ORIENTATION=+